MIKYQDEFEGYLRDNASGPGDKAAAFVKSSIASLNSVCKYLGVTINAKILGSDSDIDALCARLSKTGKVSDKNIKHYRSAMQQYVNMVNGL
ncbi:MAG: hypothetical protein AUJ57_08600 [Zetaproteobacteria bacterium CG1_02_53_45]|nr:MAG: hypothetical protein AUJ57_08600 [Zetaproteobacteria bacterium CG1_02_53_45]